MNCPLLHCPTTLQATAFMSFPLLLPGQKARFAAGMAAKQAVCGTGPSTEAVQYWEVPGAAHFVPWTHAAELAAAVAPVLAGALAVA